MAPPGMPIEKLDEHRHAGASGRPRGMVDGAPAPGR
jgi:hypothetical protein